MVNRRSRVSAYVVDQRASGGNGVENGRWGLSPFVLAPHHAGVRGSALPRRGLGQAPMPERLTCRLSIAQSAWVSVRQV